jgi:nanoRNase/pAp phosphatase (c-di-AMP/oligoRNAs hydrolase)
MEGAEITDERLGYVLKAYRAGSLVDQVFCGFLGTSPREDVIPYVADFFLQMEDVKWTVVAGLVNDSLIVSVRNLGYSKNAGEFARRFFADIGSAGGHRAMAKAVVPMNAFRDKFGDLSFEEMTPKLHELMAQFLHEPPREKEAKIHRSENEEIKTR